MRIARSLYESGKISSLFCEEGIGSFSMTCQMRQVIAMKHYEGDVTYSFYDLTQEFLNKNLDKLQIEGSWVKKEKSIVN